MKLHPCSHGLKLQQQLPLTQPQPVTATTSPMGRGKNYHIQGIEKVSGSFASFPSLL